VVGLAGYVQRYVNGDEQAQGCRAPPFIALNWLEQGTRGEPRAAKPLLAADRLGRRRASWAQNQSARSPEDAWICRKQCVARTQMTMLGSEYVCSIS
jgi:hypothetical protein